MLRGAGIGARGAVVALTPRLAIGRLVNSTPSHSGSNTQPTQALFSWNSTNVPRVAVGDGIPSLDRWGSTFSIPPRLNLPLGAILNVDTAEIGNGPGSTPTMRHQESSAPSAQFPVLWAAGPLLGCFPNYRPRVACNPPIAERPGVTWSSSGTTPQQVRLFNRARNPLLREGMCRVARWLRWREPLKLYATTQFSVIITLCENFKQTYVGSWVYNRLVDAAGGQRKWALRSSVSTLTGVVGLCLKVLWPGP